MINNSFFSIFILAHLVGDFVLQTDKIAKEKASSIKGIIKHSIIVFLVQVFLLSIFGIKGLISGIISGFAHFFIDYMKYYINKKGLLKNMQSIYFLIDQAIHVILIYILVISLGRGLEYNYFQCINYVNFISFIIILVYTAPIFSKILVFDLNLIPKDKGFFIKNERILDGLCAIVIGFSINFIYYKILIFILLILLIFVYITLGKKYFNYNIKICLIKYGIYLIISLMFLTIKV